MPDQPPADPASQPHGKKSTVRRAAGPVSAGQTFGKYTIVRELGRGGRGAVYEALDTVLDRKVALKLILPDDSAGADARREEGERFLREARLSANLPKHPHIVSVYEAGETDGKRFLAMELVQGRPLDEWRKSARVAPADQVHLLRDVALAVEHAHGHGLVHRDLKPMNILVDAEGHPHVTDFGLAQQLGKEGDSTKVAPGFVLGTPAYMSPEHARGAPTDARSDLFSLGVMLYEALTGRLPFAGKTAAEIMDRVVHYPAPAPVPADPAAVPLVKRLSATCLRALSKNPAGRHESARAFADEITGALGGSAPKKTLVLAVGAAAAVAVAVLLFLMLKGPGGPSREELLAGAAKLLGEGRHEEAAAAYKQVLDREPGNAAANEGKNIALKRASDRQRKASDEAVEGERRKQEEQAKLKDEEHKKQLSALRAADDEAALRLKMEQIRAEDEKRAALERARAAEAALKKAQEEAAKPVPAVPVPPEPAATPSNPALPFKPGPPGPAAAAPTGEPKILGDGALHFEAEDYTGLDKPVPGEDYFDSSPGNSGDGAGRQYRNFGVDIAALNNNEVLCVVDIAPGEWLRYRFQGGGKLEFEVHYQTRNASTIHLTVDGEDVSGPLALSAQTGPALPFGPPASPWITAKFDLRPFPEGPHALKMVFDQPSRLAVDWFRLRKRVRLAPPDAALVKEAEKKIRELFKSDAAKKAPADLAMLAKKLKDESRKEEHDAAMRYALLSESRELSAQAGDLASALDCIRELEKAYETDLTAARVSVAATAAKSAKTPEAWKAVAEAYLEAADQASEAEDYEAALGAVSKAEAAAKSAKDAGLAGEAQGRTKELTALRDEHRSLKGSIKALEEKPDDPAACFAVGIYTCFAREDWPRGLPLLAKGADAPVAKAAKAELDHGDEVTLGEAWSEAAAKKSTGTLKVRLSSRALHWYEKALSTATGLVRIKIESQVEALSKTVYGTTGLRRGLVFWVEPGQDSGDGFRELMSGAKVTNNGPATVVDSPSRAFNFQRTWLDYPATEAVKAIEKQGSIFAWVKAQDYQRQSGIVNRGERDVDDLGLWVSGGHVGAWFNYPGKARMQISKGQLVPNRWALVGYTWDEKDVTFYIDGKEDSSVPITSTGVPQKNSKTVSVGSNPPGGQDWYFGLVGSVMIYNRTLAATEVQQLLLGTRARHK